MRTACIALLLGLAAYSRAADALLANALHDGRVRIAVTGLGGHSGSCIKLEAWNRSAEPLNVTIPSGWRFPSSDSTLQDMLVVGDQVLALAPGIRTSLACRAFCCEATRGSPNAGAAFEQGAMADERLVKLAQHLAASGYPDDAAQQAVWAVSDGSPISGIDAGEGAVTLGLRQFVAGLTGRPVPWYTTRFGEARQDRAFNPDPIHVTGSLEFQQRHAGVLSIVVKDAVGRTIRVIDEGRDLRQGRYTIDVELTVQDWAKGRYSIWFASDGVLLKRQEFEL